MTHVSILVPYGTAVMESLVSVFTIFDQTNDHALAAGGDRLFDVHLVGPASHVELYGGRDWVRPDLRLGETDSTDLVIVPALAGNLADGVNRNPACIPWIQEQYRGGAGVAGLCTAALFIARTGLISDEHCSAHWFVDEAFRNEFSHINLTVDRAARTEGAISSTGAYSFFQQLLERAGGQALASMCSASFETVFNRQCQSVLAISDSRMLGLQTAPKHQSAPANTAPSRLTEARFASMFEPRACRQDGDLLDRGRGPHATGVNSTTLRALFKHVPTQARRQRRHEDSCFRAVAGESDHGQAQEARDV
jgi:putative intracellular protease/amidase